MLNRLAVFVLLVVALAVLVGGVHDLSDWLDNRRAGERKGGGK
jgi:hypothetical protein